MSTADMLSEVGYEVIEASSAEQALELFDSGVHVDVDMPVLIVSGYAEAEGITPELPCLTKPFRQSDQSWQT